MLIDSKQIISKAYNGHYAVGAFNTSDLEITKAIVAAAQHLAAPIIVQTSEKAIGYAGLEEIAAIIQIEAKKAKVPVALHLDHGKSLDIISKCLKAGYTSVMFDGSNLSYEENKILTKQAVELAHRYNTSCEGELGSIGKAGVAGSKGFTNPNDVADFIKFTGVDFLAVSIGSSHGVDSDENLDIDLLKKIQLKTKIPLVLHGGSGVPDIDVHQAVKNGIAKINIDTDIRHTFSKALREITKKYSNDDPREMMEKVMQEIQKIVEQKIMLFGSAFKADK